MNSTFWSQTTGNVSFWDFLWNVKLSRHPSFFPILFELATLPAPDSNRKSAKSSEQGQIMNQGVKRRLLPLLPPLLLQLAATSETCFLFFTLLFQTLIKNVNNSDRASLKKLRKIVRKCFVYVQFFSFLAQAWWQNDLLKAVFWRFSVLVNFLLLNRLGFLQMKFFFVAFRFESNK